MTPSSPAMGANWHRRLQLLPLASLVAAFLLLYGQVLINLSRSWATDDNYSHGFLILPIVGYLVWERRGRLAATERSDCTIRNTDPGMRAIARSLPAINLKVDILCGVGRSERPPIAASIRYQQPKYAAR